MRKVMQEDRRGKELQAVFITLLRDWWTGDVKKVWSNQRKISSLRSGEDEG